MPDARPPSVHRDSGADDWRYEWSKMPTKEGVLPRWRGLKARLATVTAWIQEQWRS